MGHYRLAVEYLQLSCLLLGCTAQAAGRPQGGARRLLPSFAAETA